MVAVALVTSHALVAALCRACEDTPWPQVATLHWRHAISAELTDRRGAGSIVLYAVAAYRGVLLSDAVGNSITQFVTHTLWFRMVH